MSAVQCKTWLEKLADNWNGSSNTLSESPAHIALSEVSWSYFVTGINPVSVLIQSNPSMGLVSKSARLLAYSEIVGSPLYPESSGSSFLQIQPETVNKNILFML